MPVLAYEPERLAALQRALDDLNFALAGLQRSIPPDLSNVWVSIRREMALCRAQQEKVVRVLRGESAREEIMRWVETHPSWWAKATHGRPTDIDTILRTVQSDPHSASVLVDSLDDIAPLIYGVHDIEVVRAFWLLVTDPDTTSPAVAGRRIRSLLETIFGDHPWSQGLSRSSINPLERRRIERAAKDMLGEILAPWQFHFSGRTRHWSWSTSTGIEWLRRVAASPTAAAELARGLGPSVVRGLSHLPPSSTDRYRHIDDIAFSIGVSLEILHEAGIDHAGRDHFTWTSFDELVDLAPVNAPWPLSTLISRSASWLDEQMSSSAMSDAVRRNLQRNTLTGQQVMAGLAVLTVWRSHWKYARPTTSPAAIQMELRHTYDAIDSPSARGRVVAR